MVMVRSVLIGGGRRKRSKRYRNFVPLEGQSRGHRHVEEEEDYSRLPGHSPARWLIGIRDFACLDF